MYRSAIVTIVSILPLAVSLLPSVAESQQRFPRRQVVLDYAAAPEALETALQESSLVIVGEIVKSEQKLYGSGPAAQPIVVPEFVQLLRSKRR